MGWLIALAVIVLLAVMPLGLRAKYDTDGARVRLFIGPLRFTVYPSKEKVEKKHKEKVSSRKKSKKEKPKKGGSLSDFWPLVDAGVDFLEDLLCRKLRVKLLQARIVMAGDDPCDLAIHYGEAWAALGNLVPVLERFLIIKKRDLQVQCDFTAEKTLIDANLVLSITLGRAVSLGVRHGIRVLREYMKIMKLRKGGAV